MADKNSILDFIRGINNLRKYNELLDILTSGKNEGSGTTRSLFNQNETSETFIYSLLELAKENQKGYSGSDIYDEILVNDVKKPQDYIKYTAGIGKRTDLSTEDKVFRLQIAFDKLIDKTDVMCPKDAKYVIDIDKRGKVYNNWSPYQGFMLDTIEEVTQQNIPKLWARIGRMTGANFTTYPEYADYYTYDELSLPYRKNPQAQHGGVLYSSRYFKVIDAIVSNNLGELNTILKSQGIRLLLEDEFVRICSRYQKYTEDIEDIRADTNNINTR